MQILEEKERKAQLQLQMLENAHVPKPTIVIGPDGKPRIQTVDEQPRSSTSKKSRFDLAVHPSQLNVPGVVVPPSSQVLTDHR